MIQLSDYDYPILLNPVHFHHFFKSINDQTYAECVKLNLLVLDIVKSLCVFEEADQPALLTKRYHSLLTQHVTRGQGRDGRRENLRSRT